MKNGVNADSVEDVVTLAKGMVNDEVTMDDAITKVIEKYHILKGIRRKRKSLPLQMGA
ncbi:hypothetical protein [Thalassobacillus sp. C254]|uniref:hypothetical protein n=1 Tax=Thalassobacillus sp. C254 TaxID=1225341 RepID=UPI0022B6845D|nr:hypothetical protein [Thalassobacillus sp. C254]